MPAIPRLNQYYPGIPLNELTNLYSVGDNRFPDTPASGGKPAVTHRVCLLSYLPRTLFVHDGLPFNNKYTVLLENMQNIQTIIWDHELFRNGVRTPAGNFIRTANPSEFEYDIYFQESMVDDNGLPRFDKIKITCKLDDGASNVIDLFVYHDLARATNVIERTDLDTGSPFGGNPDAFNIVSNQLKEYYSEALLTWNGHQIEANRDNNEALLKIVLAIIYYNIQYSGSMTSEASLSFDFNDFSPLQLKRCINTGAAYNGHFKTGLCQIPLHVLSDVLPPDTSGLPDYTQINTANPVYSIFEANQLLTYNNLESEVLLTIPDKLQRMRDRMVGNIPRLTDLYYLSTFPKPAIRMAAMLIKYLFESSKGNSCKECLNKDDRWLNSTLATLRDYPNFLKNILTHYFREPYNKIEEFAPEAIRATTLTFSPYIYSLIHNVAPRILKAYFAKKIVRKLDERTINGINTPTLFFEFERMDSDGYPGVHNFLIIETAFCERNSQISFGILPSSNILNTNLVQNLEVQINGTQYASNYTSNIGDFNALNNNLNQLPVTPESLEYLDVNHSNKVIVRLRIRPQQVALFNNWCEGNGLGTGLTNNTDFSLGISTSLVQNINCLFGNNISQISRVGEFLTNNDQYNNSARFRFLNRNVFEIYHFDNGWNRMAPRADGTRPLIGKLINPYIEHIANNSADSAFKRVLYIYYDMYDNEHLVCETLMHNINRVGLRLARNPPPLSPAESGAQLTIGVIGDANPWRSLQFRARGEDIWAHELTQYENGTLGSGRQRRDGTTGHYWYPLITPHELTDLINADILQEVMPPQPPRILNHDFLALGYIANNLKIGYDLNIRFFFQDTRRRYANPDLFAGVIGALAEFNLDPNFSLLTIRSEGFAFSDGSCFPSINHINGLAMDINYIPSAIRPDRAQNVGLINALHRYGFGSFIIGNNSRFDNIANSFQNNAGIVNRNNEHDDHLHCQNFAMINDAGTILGLIII